MNYATLHSEPSPQRQTTSEPCALPADTRYCKVYNYISQENYSTMMLKVFVPPSAAAKTWHRILKVYIRGLTRRVDIAPEQQPNKRFGETHESSEIQDNVLQHPPHVDKSPTNRRLQVSESGNATFFTVNYCNIFWNVYI